MTLARYVKNNALGKARYYELKEEVKEKAIEVKNEIRTSDKFTTDTGVYYKWNLIQTEIDEDLKPFIIDELKIRGVEFTEIKGKRYFRY